MYRELPPYLIETTYARYDRTSMYSLRQFYTFFTVIYSIDRSPVGGTSNLSEGNNKPLK